MKKRIISLEITEELKENLRVEAFKQRKSVSAFIRDLIQKYFNNKNEKD